MVYIGHILFIFKVHVCKHKKTKKIIFKFSFNSFSRIFLYKNR